jgi:hypothetical protein
MKLTPTQAQQDQMRHAYYDGAPGILVSGIIWLAAAGVCYLVGVNKAVWTLLIGGALIHPMSMLVTKAMGRPAKTDQANALNVLAAASTIWLIVCCAMAYGLFLLKPVLFFPALMASIGSRYLIFASVFGRSMFWALGASLIVAANLCLFAGLTPVIAAGIGGLIEVLFAFLVFSRAVKPKLS